MSATVFTAGDKEAKAERECFLAVTEPRHTCAHRQDISGYPIIFPNTIFLS